MTTSLSCAPLACIGAVLFACSCTDGDRAAVALPDGGQAGSTGAAGQSGTDGGAGAAGQPGLDGSLDADAALDQAAMDVAMDGTQEAGEDGDCKLWETFVSEEGAASAEAQKLALAEALLQQVQGAGGFPIRCADQVHFMFQAPPSMSAPHVAGDFNGWDASKAPMSLIAGSTWRASLTIDAGPNRYKYKFTDGSSWIADPVARRFGFDQNGEYALVSGGMGQGHLERLPAVSGAGLKARPLTMYLPPGYEAGGESLPVLYAHDGQNLFDPNGAYGSWKLDAAIEALLAQGEIEPMVVVGIHNTVDRMDEYTHVADDLGSGPVGGKADAYYQLVTEAVMPLVEQHYRVKTGPQNTWTMGSSLGGLISLYFGMTHPEVFGRVAGLSTTAGWGSIGPGEHQPTIIELAQSAGKQALRIYLDSGGGPGSDGCPDTDQDGIQDDSATAQDNYCESAQLRDVYAAAGYTFDVDLIHWWEPDAEHNEAAWAARLSHPLVALAGK